MTKKLLSLMALTVVLTVAATPADVVAKWGSKALGAALQVVAHGPFFDVNG